MDRWIGKVAIVTGASSGIGSDIVEVLVNEGFKVAGLARRVEKVQEHASTLEGKKGRLYPIACDVQKEEDILKAFQWVEKKLGGVDVLINNAGVASAEPIIEGSTSTFRNILEVNVLAFAITAREAVKSIRKRNAAGHIVVINSVLGHCADIITSPLSLYAASKFAVTGMVATLHNEIAAAKLNVKVTSISPGLVDTDMPTGVGFPKEAITPISIKPKDIADAVLYAICTPPNVQVKELIITPLAKLTIPDN